jgi:cytochrome c554/c'-like protein
VRSLGPLICLLLLANFARAERRDWTGSTACGTCHPQQLAAWKATPHATTQAHLSSRPETKCLACHGTGEAPAGPAIAVEVGCESCHGAGAAYAEDDLMRNPTVARALGLVDVSTPKARAAVCAQCHTRATRGKPFDPTAPVHPIQPLKKP